MRIFCVWPCFTYCYRDPTKRWTHSKNNSNNNKNIITDYFVVLLLCLIWHYYIFCVVQFYDSIIVNAALWSLFEELLFFLWMRMRLTNKILFDIESEWVSTSEEDRSVKFHNFIYGSFWAQRKSLTVRWFFNHRFRSEKIKSKTIRFDDSSFVDFTRISSILICLGFWHIHSQSYKWTNENTHIHTSTHTAE